MPRIACKSKKGIKRSFKEMQESNFQLVPWIQGLYAKGTVFIGYTEFEEIAVLLLADNFEYALKFYHSWPLLITATTMKIPNYFDKPVFGTKDAYQVIIDDIQFTMKPESEENKTEGYVSEHAQIQINKLISSMQADVKCIDKIPPKIVAYGLKKDHYISKFCYSSDIVSKIKNNKPHFWTQCQLQSINNNKIKFYWYDVPKSIGKFMLIPKDTITILYNVYVSKEKLPQNIRDDSIMNRNEYNIGGRDFVMLSMQEDTLLMWNFSTLLSNDIEIWMNKLHTADIQNFNCMFIYVWFCPWFEYIIKP